MNSNQSKNLTPKQRELVKRLEEIRSSKGSNQPQNTQGSKKRNRNMQKKKPVTTGSRQTVSSKRARTASKEKFARPVREAPAKNKPSSAYKPRYARPTQKDQPKKEKAKESGNYINQLSNGQKLSRAIILSEILDKPLALRKRR